MECLPKLLGPNCRLLGVVFTKNADGSPAVVFGAGVSVFDATTNETQAGASRVYVFTNLSPGSYII